MSAWTGTVFAHFYAGTAPINMGWIDTSVTAPPGATNRIDAHVAIPVSVPYARERSMIDLLQFALAWLALAREVRGTSLIQRARLQRWRVSTRGRRWRQPESTGLV